MRYNYKQSPDLVNALIQSESELLQQEKEAQKCNEIITLSVESPLPIVLKKNGQTIAPLLITVETKDNYELQEKRVGIDLVCVIDISGSMSGSPLKLVQKSLAVLVDLLDQQDRLCLVTFSDSAQLITPLLSMAADNKEKMKEKIEKLQAGGGTDIGKGVEIAAKVMQQRKQINSSSFIFLLSDGNDNQSGTIERVSSHIRNLKDVGIYTFGYGAENDASIMSEISGVGLGGHYYYIKKKSDVSEFLVMAIGGCLSVFAWSSKVQMKATYGKIVQIFGTKEEQQSKIWKIGALLYGRKKQMVIEMQFDQWLNDESRERKCLEIEFKGKEVAAAMQSTIKKDIVCTFCHNEEEAKQQISEELAINYFLFKGQQQLNSMSEDSKKEKKAKLLKLKEDLNQFQFKDNQILKKFKKAIKLQEKLLSHKRNNKSVQNQANRLRRQQRSRSASISSGSNSRSRSRSRMHSRPRKRGMHTRSISSSRSRSRSLSSSRSRSRSLSSSSNSRFRSRSRSLSSSNSLSQSRKRFRERRLRSIFTSKPTKQPVQQKPRKKRITNQNYLQKYFANQLQEKLERKPKNK